MARSTWHMAGLAVIGFLAAGCSPSGGDRLALLEPADGATESLTKADGGKNGDTDYCAAPANACLSGEGDCDADAQCQVGLKCGTDNGPQFGMPDGHDVCVQPHCTNNVADADETGVDCGGADCGVCVVCGGTNGDASFCMAACPCTTGQGDCDGDFQCAAGLRCGTDNGPRFGMPDGYDVCVPLHCVNGLLDADETGIDCGGADCGTCPPSCAGQVLGLSDSCTSACPCSAGQGDCDLDLQCTIGLRCGTDNGPRFGMPEGFDACVASHCTNGAMDADETAVDCGGADCGACTTCTTPNGTPDTCSSSCPCPAGGGDCDFDAQCQPGLVCGTDNGIDFGMPDGYDVCTLPACTNGVMDGTETGVDCGGACGACLTCSGVTGTPDACTSACPCGPGEGDCDLDAQCEPGLQCGTDNGPAFGLPAGFDVCFAPHCSNGVKDADEIGTDCGGAHCDACYSRVGGVVTGLTGSGLVLAIAGQPDLPVAPGATTFAFPNEIASGTDYVVTVAAQPTDQACSVHNASGTMGGEDVNGVVIDCSGAWARVEGGSNHTLGIRTNGDLYAWGTNQNGQIGDPAVVTARAPRLIGTGFSTISAGVSHSLAVKANGDLYAWGDNSYGQLGDGTTSPSLSPKLIGSGYASASAGQLHSLAIKANGDLYAWGDNSSGQLGDGTTTRSLAPKLIGSGYASVSAGLNHSLGVKTTGSLYGWGRNTSGKVGDGTITTVYAPKLIGSSYASASAGDGHSLGVKTNGDLYAWGANSRGQLGDGTTTPSLLPKPVGTGFASASAGGYHSLGITTSGDLYAWGHNNTGQLGDGSTAQANSPRLVGHGFASVSAGYAHALAIKAAGDLHSWGDNYFGQLGEGTPERIVAPERVGSGFVSVAAGNTHSLGLKANGELHAWGSNTYGQLGDGTELAATVPKLIGSGFASIASGTSHSLAVTDNGDLYAWGYNALGQLGDGSTTSSRVPKLIGAGFVSVAAGNYHSLALKANGDLFAWGSNTYGQLGDGTTTATPTPKLIGSGFASIAAGWEHSLAIKANGDLFAWGSNANGRLGDGTTTQSNTPKFIGSGYAAVSGGAAHSLGIRTNGDLMAWGSHGLATVAYAPMYVASGFTSVAAGWGHSLAVRAGGDLYAWGNDDYGQMGNGSDLGANVLKLIATGVASVAAGYGHSLAIMPNADLYAWGYDSYGQLGDSHEVYRVVPAPLPDLRPRSLWYSRTVGTYTSGYAIYLTIPYWTGLVTSFTVSPALPNGIVLNPLTGVISGTPTGPSPTTSYAVTANGPLGSTTGLVTITVN